jgi:2,3-bisphosphoglycerate-dependent phosphoglycerate mutase
VCPPATTDPQLPGTLVLLRHGTSHANLAGRVAGWEDTPLAPEGEADAHRAADRILAAKLAVDIVHVSRLSRARRTAEIVTARVGVPLDRIRATWRLNERHAGSFEGLTRDEMIERFGRDPVRSWKHDTNAHPVPLDPDDPRHPRQDPRYDDVPRHLLPSGESAADVLDRVLPFWTTEVLGDLAAGRSVLIVTHDRVLRVLVAHLASSRPSPFADGGGPGRVPWVVTLRADGRGLAEVTPLGAEP